MEKLSVSLEKKTMVDDIDENDEMKFSHDMTPDELYDVIAEEIDHIYAVD
jgi:hypothetical protein